MMKYLAILLCAAHSLFGCPSDCGRCNAYNVYIGGIVGAGSHAAYRNDLDGYVAGNGGRTSLATGFAGGGQLGVDWNQCSVPIGIVGDFISLTSSSKQTLGVSSRYIQSECDWISTMRARSGIAIGSGLVYVTAGAAYAKFKTRWQDGSDERIRFNRSRWGWTGGAGAVCDLPCRLSIGAEFLFAHFSQDRERFRHLYTLSQSDSLWLGKVFLNYNFGNFTRIRYTFCPGC